MPMSAEARQRLSESRKGSGNPMFGKRGAETGMFGKQHSVEARRKMSNAGKGRKFSEEHKRNLSESLRARVRSQEHCQNISKAKTGVCGRRHSPETKQKLSDAMYQRIEDWDGEHHWLWRGGRIKYDTAYWKHQRKQALMRDGYRCRHCGEVNGLAVHHLKPLRLFSSEKAAHSLDNLLSLCPACHGKAEIIARSLYEVKGGTESAFISD